MTVDERQFDSELSKWLLQISSLSQLKEEVGEISPGERNALSQLNLFAEPAAEELVDFGPEFIERIFDQLEQRRKSGDRGRFPVPIDWGRPFNPILSEGLALIRVLNQVEERAILRGEPAPELGRKATKILEELADVFLDDLERMCV